jgi:hypothetical protein
MLIDTFMFYNEFDVLELRLEVLDEYVDKFVLVESEVNHAGGPKELFFAANKDRYAKWLHKIEHVVVTADESPKGTDPWLREKYQRAAIVRGLDDVPSEAIIMLSDVDEIPDMTRVPFENLGHIITSVHMWMFEYSLDYVYTGEPWFGTVITNVDMFKHVGPNHLRDNRWKFPVVTYAGWHLSSFGTPAHVWNKMTTYAHARDAQLAGESLAKFTDYMSQGLHTDGATRLLPRPSNAPLPGSVDTLRRLGLLAGP